MARKAAANSASKSGKSQSRTTSSGLPALDFLESPAMEVPRLCAVVGEPYLRSRVLRVLREQVLGTDDGQFSLKSIAGRDADWRSLRDELATVSLFGGRRLVIVDEADEFVSKNRASLEEFAAQPRGAGVLVLDLASFPATTRLAKQVAETGLIIDAQTPNRARLARWLVAECRRTQGATLEATAAEELIELCGDEPGLLEQEVAKLAAFAGAGGQIKAEDVRTLAGGWRSQTAWDLLDAAAVGDAVSALSQLDRLLLAGEQPIGLLGQVGFTLRRYAEAARRVVESEAEGKRITPSQALSAAGIKPFVLAKSEQQLRQLGRQRALALASWVLEADLALKGGSALPPRLVLEQLVVRMSRAAG